MEFFFVLAIAYNLLMPRINAAGEIYNEGLLWIAFVIAGGVWLVVHVLKSIGLYTMAKKQNMGAKLLWCAFVPFANTFLMGELGGKFGRNFKHVGLYAMIAELLYCAACAVYFGMMGFAIMNGMYEKYIQTYTGYDGAVYERYTLVLSGLTPTAERMIEVFYYIQYIFSFIAPVVCIFLYIVFFRKYAPSSYIWMTVLCAIVPLFIGPLVFAYRKRTPVDYDAFMRARYEQIRRQQQQYYNQQNPYGQQGPYGGPYGPNRPPYGNPYGNPNQPPYGAPNGQQGQPQNGDDDPFGEFSGGGSAYGSGQNGQNGSSSDGADGNGNSRRNGSGGSDDGFFN